MEYHRIFSGDLVKGVAYMSKERYDKMVGDNGKPWKEHADYLIDLEVKEIGVWMWGDVKGYVLEKKVPFTKVYDDDDREDEEDIEWGRGRLLLGILYGNRRTH